MNSAAVIIIGNEILSGRTQDTNLLFLGQRLASLGINLQEACVIPDIEEMIITKVNQYRKAFTYVFTTGGIGPTHDDITSASIAKAFAVPLEINDAALACLEKYYPAGTINAPRMKMAYIPQNAILIENPVSGAPGFQLQNVFVLPGVPQILQAMFDGISDRLVGGPPILSKSISTNLRESNVAEGLAILQNRFPVVTIGSYPYFKNGKLGVSLVMRSTDKNVLDVASTELRELVKQTGGKILYSD